MDSILFATGGIVYWFLNQLPTGLGLETTCTKKSHQTQQVVIVNLTHTWASCSARTLDMGQSLDYWGHGDLVPASSLSRILSRSLAGEHVLGAFTPLPQLFRRCIGLVRVFGRLPGFVDHYNRRSVSSREATSSIPSGGPTCTEASTIFEMWLGAL